MAPSTICHVWLAVAGEGEGAGLRTGAQLAGSRLGVANREQDWGD